MRSFWLLTGATAISNAGNTFLYLAVPWALVSTTGSSLLAVLSLAAQTLPFLAAPFLGAVIDRHDRRFLFAAAEITQGCCVALIPLLLAMNAIGAVFAVLFVTGLAKVITEVVGSYALIPALVPKERLDRACGAFNSIQLVARFAGPALAGLTIAAVGPGWALAIDAATFLCTSLTALVLPRLRAGGRRQPLGAMLREGARFFRERPNLRRLTLALALYNLGAGGLEPTLLSLGANHWNWSATTLGVLVSAGAVAAAAGAWLSRAVPGRHRRITLWFGVMAAGSLGLLFGAPVAVTIGFCVLSLGEGGVNAATMAYRQHEIPPDLAGRVNTVIRMFVTGAIPASALLLGLTANLVSSGWLFLPVALPALLGLAVWTSRRKEGAVKNVLLVNSNSRAPARMLQDRKDIRLSVISMPGHLDHYDEGTDVEVVDSIQDLTQVRLAALRIRRRNPFDHVVAPAEWSLQAGGYLRSLFGLPGPDYAVVNAFSNKLVMKQRLRAAGLPVARFLLVDQFTDAIAAGAELGWPVFLKRTHGGGATDMFVLTDAAEVTALAADERTARLRVSPYPMLAEELLDIEAEFHCDGVVAGGAVRFASVARYLTPVLGAVGEIMLGSYTLPPDHPDAKIVADLHEQAVTVLGLTDGVTHLEILKCPRGYLVGEITCRPGGNGVPEQIRHQYGVDFWRSFLATSMGEDAGIATPPSARPGHLINFMLPRPVGTVTAITSAADLLALPGVEHAEVRTRVGDTTPAPLDSSVTAGTVLMRVDSEAEVPAGVARLAGRFRVEVAP